MGRKRRQVSPDDDGAWVFNEMASVYDARPSYPPQVVAALVELADAVGNRVVDLGAGTGHLALPLAERGLEVVAIEPARAMLDRLRRAAADRRLQLETVHAAAEALPFDGPRFDLALIADAMHFLDAELVAAELRRVLVPGGALVVITCALDRTPFMNEVRNLLEAASDRRPRDTTQAIRHLAALADVRLTRSWNVHDETAVAPTTLEGILRSFSFVGPAMNPNRLQAFCARLHALSSAPTWARCFTLHVGHRRRRRRAWQPPLRSR
jgi:ubiquinone/menaquinone biosynthesis C-methylase UbiE